jgi:hypothetical protein
MSIRAKLRIFRSNVKSGLLYGSETWKVAKTTISKLQKKYSNPTTGLVAFGVLVG